MTTSEFLTPAPPNYVWPQCPEADQFVRARIEDFLSGHSFARRLSERMTNETSTEFQMWVDHIILPKNSFDDKNLAKLGFEIEKGVAAPAKTAVLHHPFADLPRLLISPDAKAMSCAIMVDSVADFQLAHNLSLPVEGMPLSVYRECRLTGETGDLLIVERRGGRTMIPDRDDRASKYMANFELWLNRQRRFSSREEGMEYAQKRAEQMVRSVGTGAAAWIFLEAERRYWHARNRAAQVQKIRQDKLGLGWANHDHHTFRSSRPAFPPLINILKTFGFKKRERYYAGAEARWGAQIMEQPEARLIIFADVDLTQDDMSVDFSSTAMPDLPKPGTVGLWCALHGESMLEAGMHHLEAKFDFEHLKGALKDFNVSFMKPFSDFPHLRQAFSEGEWWPVPVERLNALRKEKKISDETYEKIKKDGAVGSHMENLQRKNGFKGFNQRGVSQIIREVNPAAQAMKKPARKAS